MTDVRVQDFAQLLAKEDEAGRAALISKVKLLAMNAADPASFEPLRLLAQRDEGLAQMVRDGVPDPTFLPSPTLGEGLFYEDQMFLFAGHKKAGKSWAMTLLAFDVMNAGRPVVYIDNENGLKLFARRLGTIRAKPETVGLRLHYVPFPKLPGVDDLRDEFEHIAEKHPGALVVLDSLRTFMSKYRLDPNKDVDVENFLGPIMAAVKTPGARLTVGVIDHSNRTTKAGDQFAAAGSFAKPAAVDSAYFFDKVEAFSVQQQGLVSINAVDDREGLLDFKRFYRVGGQGKGEKLFWKPADARTVGTTGRLMGAIWQFLADHDGEPQTKSEIRRRENIGKGANEDKDTALAQLVENPDVPVYMVPGRTEKMPPLYGCDVERWQREQGRAFSEDAMEF